jgi:hypothetical protein
MYGFHNEVDVSSKEYVPYSSKFVKIIEWITAIMLKKSPVNAVIRYTHNYSFYRSILDRVHQNNAESR